MNQVSLKPASWYDMIYIYNLPNGNSKYRFILIHGFLFSWNWPIFESLLNINNFTWIAGLAGATADVHCYDVLTNKWSR